MVARQLAHLAAEDRRTVGEQDLGFADAARIQQQVSGRRVARVILVAEVQVEVAERDPGGLSAPARLDETGLEWQHRREPRTRPGRPLDLEPGIEFKAADSDPYSFHVA